MLSIKYGKKINWNNNDYYLFPTPESLKDITIEELNSMKMGFRSKYIYEIINKVSNNDFDIDYINEVNTEVAIEYLTKYKGIGLKVASCILLFGYKRFDVFPIDTWVKKMMKELYGIDDMKSIKNITKNKFKEYSGVVIQYMFHSKRNK
jgi:N-glycosylase/DNA lyase